jgi:hypothetical protein
MVEILKEGKLPSERKHVCICATCSTKFKFAESEANYVSDQRDGDAWAIHCPVCKTGCWIAA